VPNYKLQIILIIVHYYAETTKILWYPWCDVTFLQNVAMIGGPMKWLSLDVVNLIIFIFLKGDFFC
jgi:hypothetical protein